MKMIIERGGGGMMGKVGSTKGECGMRKGDPRVEGNLREGVNVSSLRHMNKVLGTKTWQLSNGKSNF